MTCLGHVDQGNSVAEKAGCGQEGPRTGEKDCWRLGGRGPGALLGPAVAESQCGQACSLGGSGRDNPSTRPPKAERSLSPRPAQRARLAAQDPEAGCFHERIFPSSNQSLCPQPSKHSDHFLSGAAQPGEALGRAWGVHLCPCCGKRRGMQAGLEAPSQPGSKFPGHMTKGWGQPEWWGGIWRPRKGAHTE